MHRGMANEARSLEPRKENDEAHRRIAEIGEILAAGLMRLSARQSSEFSSQNGESSLEPVGQQSGHANSETENRE